MVEGNSSDIWLCGKKGGRVWLECMRKECGKIYVGKNKILGLHQVNYWY